MAKIPFKVSARTAKLIGLENFSNEEGAITELVKNTYDADAKNCILIFDFKYKEIEDEEKEKELILDKGQSRIYIIDNGDGMTKDIISNQWMTIGTDDKLTEPLTGKGRVKTGAKGIGRFALNRLGSCTKLLTIPKKKDGKSLFWQVGWDDFDISGRTVSEVTAVLEERENLNIKKEVQDRFPKANRLQKLLKEIEFNSGTIIEIYGLTDNWEYSQLTKLFSGLEMLLPPKEQPDFKINFFSISSPEEFGEVKGIYYDDFDYKIEANYSSSDEDKLEIKVTRNELDVDILEEKYVEVFDYDDMKKYPYRLKDFKEKTIIIDTSLRKILSSDVNDKLISKIGEFGFIFYFLKNTISDNKNEGDKKKYPYKNFNSSNRKSWLGKFGGVKIFRDDFRVRPYGENGEDWLKLGSRQAKSPGGAGQKLGGYRIRPNQISGTIKISRVHNESFQDKSGREGIIENDVFDLFKNIIEEIISKFENDRNTVMHHLSMLHTKRNKIEDARIKALEEAERINQEEDEEADEEAETEGKNTNNDNQSSDSESSKSSEREKSLAKGVKILAQEVEEKEEEIRLLRNFASVGLIISSFAHEVKSLRSRLVPRTTHLTRELRIHLNEEKLDLNLDKDDNPFHMIDLIRNEDTKLKHWLEYSLNTLKRDKRERKNLNFDNYFERFRSTWSKALEQRNIKIKLYSKSDEISQIRAFEVDMDSIFNNLLSNSLSALKGKKDKQKLITITWMVVKDNIEIIFSDNGKGLDNQYDDYPDNIFKLLESSKKDKKGNIVGTGLGLYIAKSIIEEYNDSTISIISSETGLAFKITFKKRVWENIK